MRTNQNIQRLAKAMASSLSAVASVVVACAMLPASSRADASAAPDASKPYTLFMGTDLALKLKDGTYPVWDIAGGSWIANVNGHAVPVDVKEGPLNLKLKPVLKLTDVSASIENLKKEPEYTPENDPYTKFTKATNKAASDYAQSQFAANYGAALMYRVDALTGNGADPGQVMPGGSTSDSSSNAQRSLADAAGYVTNASMAAGAIPGLVVKTGGNPDLDSFDALDIAFDVSAPKPLNRPYLVIICRYHERNGPQGSYRDWINARPLDIVDSKPQHVHFLAGGFTPGYELKSFELHLYNNGTEVATNVSQKRTEYTLDEAFEYYMKAYVGSHRSSTLPAVPAMGRTPADLSSRLAQGLMVKTVFVKVSRDGIGTSAYLDETCSRKVEDPYVDSVIRDIRFKPALENGQPVEGVAMLKLDHLAL